MGQNLQPGGTRPPPTGVGFSPCHGNTRPPGAVRAGNPRAPSARAWVKRLQGAGSAPVHRLAGDSRPGGFQPPKTTVLLDRGTATSLRALAGNWPGRQTAQRSSCPRPGPPARLRSGGGWQAGSRALGAPGGRGVHGRRRERAELAHARCVLLVPSERRAGVPQLVIRSSQKSSPTM